MPADGPSRGGHVQFPAPQREWVAAFLDGNNDALARRFGPTQLPADFDTEDHDPTLGVRIGEAKKPGPRVPRYDVDLRERVFGGETTRARRARLLERLHQWLAMNGRDSLDHLAAEPERLDQALSDYGQHLWSNDAAQGDFAETLNHIKKLYRGVTGRLHGAWDVRTAWQLMEPGENRAPIPARLVVALVVLFLIWEWPEMAALMALGFEGGLRPGDLLYLNRGDLRFPREHGGATRALFVVLRHSKTRERRDAARYQHVRITCATVAALLDRVFGQRDRAAALFSWPGNHAARSRQMSARFAAGLRALGVPYGQAQGYTLGGLRGGGITAFFEATGDLQLTRWRGRWDSMRSMEDYIQELASHEAFARLPPPARARIFRLAGLLGLFVQP